MMQVFSLALACLGLLGHGLEAHEANEKKQSVEAHTPLMALSSLFLAASPASGWQVAGTSVRCGNGVNHFSGNCLRSRPVVLKAKKKKKSSEGKVRRITATQSPPSAPGEIKDAQKAASEPPASENSEAVMTAAVESVGTSDSDYEKFDKDAAWEKFNGMMSQLNEIMSNDMKDMSMDQKFEKVEKITALWFEVAVPIFTFTLLEFAILIPYFAVVLAVLSFGPYSFDQIKDALSGIELLSFLKEPLSQVDPTVGNFALALVLCEITYPLQLAAAIGLMPAAMKASKATLKENGIDGGWLFNKMLELRGVEKPA